MKNRDLVRLLKAELDFLELGGYDHAMGAPWRPAFIFEDSPSCLNFREAGKHPCSECALMALVPTGKRGESVPCRFIPLDQEGQTLHSLYASATRKETVATVRAWLKETIERLEREAAGQQERGGRAS